MSNDPYILITADTHAGGSHAQYREYLEPRWREAFDEWRGGYRNPSQQHYGTKKLRNWDLEVRTTDQNSQGVVGEVVYPNTVPPFFSKSIVTAQPPRPENYERALAGIRAHNRWLVDFCAEDPDRRAGVGLILPNDIDEAIKDVQWIAKAGLRGGVLLPLVPEDCTWLKPLYHPDWEPLYAAIQDCDLVMNQHSGQGLPDYGSGPVAEVGIEQICWGNDYPHYEGTFPYNLESLQLTFPGIPEHERRMILGENAARLYKFDLEKLRSLAAQHGPTPQQVDTPLQAVPEDSGCYLFVDERMKRAAAGA